MNAQELHNDDLEILRQITCSLTEIGSLLDSIDRTANPDAWTAIDQRGERIANLTSLLSRHFQAYHQYLIRQLHNGNSLHTGWGIIADRITVIVAG